MIVINPGQKFIFARSKDDIVVVSFVEMRGDKYLFQTNSGNQLTFTRDDFYDRILKPYKGTVQERSPAKSTAKHINVKIKTDYTKKADRRRDNYETNVSGKPSSGDEGNVSVKATIDENNAKIEIITEKELEKVGTGENVTIDLSEIEYQGEKQEISEVTLTTETVDNIKESPATGLEIKLSTATVIIDQDTLSAVADQATGSEIKLVVNKDDKAEKSMNEAQKETVDQLDEPVVLDAYFISNGKRIGDFKGGTVKILVEYPTDRPIKVWFVADNGDKESVKSEFNKEKQIATFEAEHFSHYVIEQSEIDISTYELTLSSHEFAFANKTLKPEVTVQGDIVLTEGVDYTVDNPGGKNVGTYTVTVTGIGDYIGTLFDTYIINPPAKAIKTVYAGKKKLTVKWKKSKKAYTAARTGYQIRYSTSKSFKKYKTRKVGRKATSKTIKGLKAHKKYYVKMRAYKKVDGQTYYSNWSKVKVKRTK